MTTTSAVAGGATTGSEGRGTWSHQYGASFTSSVNKLSFMKFRHPSMRVGTIFSPSPCGRGVGGRGSAASTNPGTSTQNPSPLPQGEGENIILDPVQSVRPHGNECVCCPTTL